MECTNTAIPNWYFYLNAVTIFVYQLMDNLDGKQARRTGTSSPLGELFDHGCDSLFLLLVSVALKTGLDLGNWEAYYMLTAGVLVFYASHWEEYHTNHLILGTYANPTEAQCGMMVLLVISGYFGPSFWSTPLFSAKVPFFQPDTVPTVFAPKTFIVIITMLGCIYTLAENAYKTILWASQNNKSFFHAVSPILPMLAHISLMVFWTHTSPSNIVEHNLFLVVLMTSLVFSLLCDWLVVCRVTRVAFNIANPILLIPVVGAMVSYSRVLHDGLVLQFLCAVLFCVYGYFITCIVLQLKYHLDIWVFTIKPK